MQSLPLNRPHSSTVNGSRSRTLSRGPSVALALALATGIVATTFVAGGGLQLGPLTTVEIVAALLAAVVICIAAIKGRPSQRAWGGGTVAAFVLLTVVTGVSIIWSIQPSESWIELNRTATYLWIFAAAVALSWLLPGRSSAILTGVLLAAVAISGYALLTKVFPASLDPKETYARLRTPFDYWNAVGLMAVFGVPCCLWLGSRRNCHTVVRSLAYPALGLLIVTVMFSFSRGSLVATAVGTAFWFCVVPRRLRALCVLASSALVAGGVVAWAFSQKALAKDNIPLAARTDTGHELGLILLGLVVVLLAVGLLVDRVAASRPLDRQQRRKCGIAALAVLALIPIGGAIALAASERGFTGQISHSWSSLTKEGAVLPSNDPSRLTAASSVRARYWREAYRIWEATPWIGAGAGSYVTARRHYRKGKIEVRHAHGYIIQAGADLGAVGIAVSLLLLAAWLSATARATGLRRADRGWPYENERIALISVATIAVIFGVHSTIDWTWFIPGTAFVALLCAGWLVGHGPLESRTPEGLPIQPKKSGLGSPGVIALRVVSCVAVAAIAGLFAWTTWQPLRAFNAGNESLEKLAEGKLVAARKQSKQAQDYNPLSVEPLFDQAAIEAAAGRPKLALSILQRAVKLQPANYLTWERLGQHQLTVLNQPKAAIISLQAAIFLDPYSPVLQAQILQAYRQLSTAGSGTTLPGSSLPSGSQTQQPGTAVTPPQQPTDPSQQEGGNVTPQASQPPADGGQPTEPGFPQTGGSSGGSNGGSTPSLPPATR